MISKTAEYALRAVIFLAENVGTGHTTEQIARATHIPAAYLSKVLQQLSKTGVVQSQRGLGGGFSLHKEANDISILEIVNSVDPINRIMECPLGLDAHAMKLCALHRRLDEASELVERAFAQSTIAELLADPKGGNVYTFPFQKNEGKKPSKRRKS
ncbi:MAG: Rrf2 family transcriptional regulator [Candidatus Melainabacteria bacterium]|nr:Rrf2 family transcriptional regulator [Candidatus Melainabacteria bacterium]